MKILKRAICGLCVAAILSSPVFFATEAKAATAIVMQMGSRGEQVSQLQVNLKLLGYYNYSKVTGYYGSVTRYAVMKFQQAHSLYVDGIAGPNTLSKINAAMNNLYTVKSGDSLWTIALKYGTTIDSLKALNNLSSDVINVGQVLKVNASVQNIAQAPAKAAESVAAVNSQTQSEDLYWLARIIEAEASGEPYIGKVAVGSVVLNRKASPDFPNTVKEIVFDDYKGIPQFSPVADGTIYNTPSLDSIKAANEALSGSRPVGNATYFFNPAKSAAPWITSNKTYLTRIGNHVFYQ